jgi:two-component system NtrC family sensor kinase
MFSVTVSPLAARRRDERWMVLVLSDVTESRRLQQQLAHSEKMSSLGQMISGVAHELNNPLSSILGYAQLLRAGRQPEQLAKRVEVLGAEAERCRKIVQNLLSFARRRRPEREPLSLNEVIQGVHSLMGYQLRVDDIEVHTELSPDLPMLHGDRHELQQVMVNLLTNAQQAIQRQSGGGGEITLRTETADDGSIVVEVGDSGPGIPGPIRDKIFDPFFTTKGEGQGTGLGLSLVYGIVRSHGGEVEALPGRERGATFRITLPAGTGSRASRVDAEQSEERPADLLAPRPSRILIVDDEPSLARLICEALAEDGHRAECVGDGHQALRRLDEREYDLVISDIKMPGMGGERLYEEMQRRKPGVSRRLMLTTGDTVGEGPQQVVARTGLELLHKPFDVDHLRRVVRRRLAALSGGPDEGS